MSKRKNIYSNAFHMNCVVHQSPGLWTHPEDQMRRYKDLRAWVELAQLLERGKFDGLFLADVIGVYDVTTKEGTYREKLFGRGRARLLDRHPGSRYRR